MFGKLTRFELKKLLGGKFFLIALGLLLIADVLLNCGIPNYRMLREAEAKGQLLGSDTVGSFWEQKAGNRRTTAFLEAQYAPFREMTPEEMAAFEAAMKEKYGESVFDSFPVPTEEMEKVPGLLGENYSDLDSLVTAMTLKEKNETVDDLRARAVRAAQAYGRDALEAGDSYGIRRNLQIIRLYSAPTGKISNAMVGWDLFLFEDPGMLLVFLLVFLVCAGSVSGEGERQTWLLLHTAKNGKGRTLAAKYFAGTLTAVGLTLVFRLVCLGAVWFQGGLLGGEQPVTILENLRLCPYRLTVWQYALAALSCQCLAAAVWAALLTTVSAFSKNSLIAYGTGAVLLGLCLLPVYLPPRGAWLSGPLTLSAPLKYFDTYYTANLFGFPVLWAVVQGLGWCLLCGVGGCLAHRVYHRKRGAV